MLEVINRYFSIIAIAVSTLGLFILSYKSETDISILKFFLGFLGGIAGIGISYFAGKIILTKPKSTVFIVHSLHDKAFAMKLSSTLEKKKIKVIDEDEIIQVGDNIVTESKKAIEESDYVIFILSNDSKKDKIIHKLIVQSKSKAKKIVPVIIEKGEEVPNLISSYKAIDTTENYEKATNELANRLIGA